MSGFFVFKRGKYYYARLKNPTTGEWTNSKSTGQTDLDEARFIAHGWFHGTIPEGQKRVKRDSKDFFNIESICHELRTAPLTSSDIPKILNILKERGFIENAKLKGENQDTFIDFMFKFWDFKTSPYVEERKAHGKSISQNHCQNNTSYIKNYWEPYFNDKLLFDITRKEIKDFSIWLSKEKRKKRINGELISFDELLSTSSRNNILKAGTVALKWAALEKIIPENPAMGISFFSGKAKKRGILSDEEAKRLFLQGYWGINPANKLGNYTAMQTGLRRGEICALRVKDILPDRIQVKHSWSSFDHLKSTKTNEIRSVAINPSLATTLLNYAKTTPHNYEPNSFIFYHINDPAKPHDGKLMYRALKKALESIGIGESNRKSMNINFHSWRHYFAKHMVDVLDQRAADLTGHATPEMLAHYADHAAEQDFEKAKEAVSNVFGNIIPFTMEGAI